MTWNAKLRFQVLNSMTIRERMELVATCQRSKRRDQALRLIFSGGVHTNVAVYTFDSRCNKKELRTTNHQTKQKKNNNTYKISHEPPPERH